jgi:NADH:ubiquinone oxidoreductase subunit 6 (subunit J)
MFLGMSRIEKKLCALALVFVIVYLGAVVLTIHSRIEKKDESTKIESASAAPDEGHIMLAELFLPMMILFTVTVCFIIAKKRREKARRLLDVSTRVPQTNPDISYPDRA